MNILNPTIDKKKLGRLAGDQRGFTLVLTMIFLVVLSLIGITAIRSSRIEVQIAGNERWATDSFYRSESGCDITTRLLVDMARGKVGGSGSSKNLVYGETLLTDVDFDLGSKFHGSGWTGESEPGWGTAENLKADVFWPENNISHADPYTIGNKQAPLTQILAIKKDKKPVGSSVETGRSGGSASSGAQAYFDIWSKTHGRVNSETVLHIHWLYIE